jgi:hypothetical protein
MGLNQTQSLKTKVNSNKIKKSLNQLKKAKMVYKILISKIIMQINQIERIKIKNINFQKNYLLKKYKTKLMIAITVKQV